ncbi:MAG: phosphatase PAP2 family protein [Nanoarchaeota archaeon]
MDIWLLISDSLFLLFILAMINSMKKKEFGKFITSFLIVLGTVWLIKEAFKIPRPYSFNNSNYGYSFISMHAALAFQSIYFLREYVVLWIWPLLIAISRIKLGVHRFIDVLLGSIYGLYVSFVIDKEWNRLKRNFIENKGEILRKLVHITFYLTYPFLALYNVIYFYVYTIFTLVALFIIILTQGEAIGPFKELENIKREKESLYHITYFPLLSLLLMIFFNDPYLVAFVGLTFAIGDGLVGLLNILIRNYRLSLAITSFYLFLIVSTALDLKFGIFSAISFLLADFISKIFRINDNYTIPLISFLIYFLII